MTKLRAVATADGRIGFPDVLVYELTNGPDAGAQLAVPPTIASHPDPASMIPPPLSSSEAAEQRAKWVPRARASYSFRVVILDYEAWRDLATTGFWESEAHLGRPEGVVVDRRPVPQS